MHTFCHAIAKGPVFINYLGKCNLTSDYNKIGASVLFAGKHKRAVVIESEAEASRIDIETKVCARASELYRQGEETDYERER